MELNPNHKVTQALHGNWHALCAVILKKIGKTEFEITREDVKALGGNTSIVLDAREENTTGTLIIRLVDNKTAAGMAREEGGRVQDN